MLSELQLPEDVKAELEFDDQNPHEYDHVFAQFTKKHLIGKNCVITIKETESKGHMYLNITQYEPTNAVIKAPNIVLKEKSVYATSSVPTYPTGDDDVPF